MTFKALFKEQEKTLESEFFEFLRYPSISADAVFRPELRACAEWVEKFLKNSGFTVEMWNKDEVPVIFAENCTAGPDSPTILIYNHYDVQPVDPIDLWESKPFEPTRKGNQIVARGAQDNKGQCFYVLSALRALYKKHGKFPLNIKLLIEGEEESGSKSLPAIIEEKKKALKADYLLVVDVGMPDASSPAITLGTRGLTSFTVEVTSSHSDLHSGVHGGIVYNPLHALVEILASLRDVNGRITVPGFYDDVKTPTAKELEHISLAFNEQDFAKEIGCLPTGGEKGLTPLERNWLRPTLELNGISGGYGGPGTKTVIPAKAIAKISCRLVPDQDPHTISERVKRFIESKQSPGYNVVCQIHEGMGKPVRTSPHSEVVKALTEACEKVYNKKTAYIYEGASIPIISELAAACQAEVCFFGLGLASDKIHAPNENFGWDRIENGFMIICDALTTLGAKK
ncbi:MAG: dipeptidase [Verrucomicrobia bacterium]|nr:dipeptidase [Verrucomicrobiota bacterium]